MVLWQTDEWVDGWIDKEKGWMGKKMNGRQYWGKCGCILAKSQPIYSVKNLKSHETLNRVYQVPGESGFSGLSDKLKHRRMNGWMHWLIDWLMNDIWIKDSLVFCIKIIKWDSWLSNRLGLYACIFSITVYAISLFMSATSRAKYQIMKYHLNAFLSIW